MIPDLSFAENIEKWRALEGAKHRLFYTLFQLQLPVETQTETPTGLAFQFLADVETPGIADHDRSRRRRDYHQSRRSR